MNGEDERCGDLALELTFFVGIYHHALSITCARLPRGCVCSTRERVGAFENTKWSARFWVLRRPIRLRLVKGLDYVEI